MRDPYSIGGDGQTFGPVAVPSADVPKSSYRAVYPDRIWPAATAALVCAMPFFFAPTTLVAASFDPATIAGELVVAPPPIWQRASNQSLRLGATTPDGTVEWLPEYPDWIARHDPFPQGWFAEPIEPPAAPLVTPLSWAPEYPDWLEQPAALIEFRLASVTPLVRHCPTVEYPTPAALPTPADGWIAFVPVVAPVAPALSWAPIYPDPVRVTRAAEGWLSFVPVVAAPAVTLWAPSYPDLLARPRPTPGQATLDPFPRPDAPLVHGWRPSYPDWLPLPRPVGTGTTVVDPFPRPDAPLVHGWRPQVPDWFPPARLVPTGAFTLDPFPRPDAPLVHGWWSLYPSWLPPARLVPQGWIAFVPIVPPNVNPYHFETVNVRRMRRAPHISDADEWLFTLALQVDIEAGVGLDGLPETGRDPQLMLRWSDDDGGSWSNEHWVSAGLIGQFGRRAIWRRLGRSRDRIYELVVSDPVKWQLIAAYLDVLKGSN